MCSACHLIADCIHPRHMSLTFSTAFFMKREYSSALVFASSTRLPLAPVTSSMMADLASEAALRNLVASVSKDAERAKPCEYHVKSQRVKRCGAHKAL